MHPFLNHALAFAVLVAATTSLTTMAANPSDPLPLWPKGAPGDSGNLGEEHDTSKPSDGKVAGKPVIRLGNVSQPSLTVYRPAPEKDTGTAVVVCPGGGYSILAMDLEGTEICEWLNSVGVTGVLLKYRVPAGRTSPRQAAPLQDAQRALGLVRQHAKDWHLNEKQIGILGFSAGGHLSALASTDYEKRSYNPIDAADELSCRPDFTILIYPAYLTAKGEPEKLAPELKVNSQTPPAFLVQTQDDGVGVVNVMTYARSLQTAKVSAELHVFPKGGHGYGLRPSDNAVSHWPAYAEGWMRGLGLLEKQK